MSIDIGPNFYRYWSKLLFGTIPTPAYDIPVSILHKSIACSYRPVRVADGSITTRCRFIKNASWDIGFTLMFCVKVFFDVVYIWYNYRCWSKILLSPNNIPAHDLQVKVTDLEILC